MPSFGRLAAAVLFAALGWSVSQLVAPLFLEERTLPMLGLWNVAFGAVLGWRIAGSRAGQRQSAAIGYGITTTVSLFVTALFFHSAAELIGRSMRRLYDGTAEAVMAVFSLMYEFGERIATVDILTASLVGGLMAAMLAEATARRFD